jgi:hypothetical protein
MKKKNAREKKIIIPRRLCYSWSQSCRNPVVISVAALGLMNGDN